MLASRFVADAEVDLILRCFVLSFACVKECHELATAFCRIAQSVDCFDFDVCHIWLFLIFVYRRRDCRRWINLTTSCRHCNNYFYFFLVSYKWVWIVRHGECQSFFLMSYKNLYGSNLEPFVRHCKCYVLHIYGIKKRGVFRLPLFFNT